MERVISTRKYVDAMLMSGYHRVTEYSRGLSEVKYRLLWPDEIRIPSEYLGRFEEILLLDFSIDLEDLHQCGGIDLWRNPYDFTDFVESLSSQVKRCVVFIQFEERNIHQHIEECISQFSDDEFGLAIFEGFHLIVQHKIRLKQHPMYLLGSRSGRQSTPFVRFQNGSIPVFDSSDARHQKEKYRIVTRGKNFLPVSLYEPRKKI